MEGFFIRVNKGGYVTSDKNTGASKTNITVKIWNFFTSLKLVISLLLVLSALSIAGTIIEQNKPLHEYYRVFRPETVALFNKLGLMDMYHSWWFISCLALLALNIIACTMDRYSGIMSGIRRKNPILDETLEKSLQPLEKIKYDLPFEDVEQKILGLVKRNFSAKPTISQTEDAKHYFFEKGRYSRLAFFLTHLSILMIFIGAIIGSLFGYKGYVNIFEGNDVSSIGTRAGKVEKLSFAVKCNTFNVDFYPNGMPQDYRSDLSVIKNGREARRKTIHVNDPLTFEGVTFYQSSYGELPDAARIEIKNKDGVLMGDVAAPFGVKVDIPGAVDKIEVADYQDHFQRPDGSEAGPALGVNIYPVKGEPAGLWLLEKDTAQDGTRFGDYFFMVKEIKLKKYTGLQVNRDPGEVLVWLGSVLLIAGIMIAFFASHKKLWVRLKKDKKGKTEVTTGGTANKNRNAFTRELEGLIQGFKEIT
jgi:cytochrome c biogenesis protein